MRQLKRSKPKLQLYFQDGGAMPAQPAQQAPAQQAPAQPGQEQTPEQQLQMMVQQYLQQPVPEMANEIILMLGQMFGMDTSMLEQEMMGGEQGAAPAMPQMDSAMPQARRGMRMPSRKGMPNSYSRGGYFPYYY